LNYIESIKSKLNLQISFYFHLHLRQRYSWNSKNPLYETIMDVLAESNPEELVEVYKKMEIAKISEGNKAFLMDVVKKLEIDKKLIEEGRLEGKIEDAKNLLNLGVSVDIIIKGTGLSEEEVLKL
jgi:predicted transposase/invertase (TIGR01784 family)